MEHAGSEHTRVGAGVLRAVSAPRVTPRPRFTATAAVLVFAYSFWHWLPILEWLRRPAEDIIVPHLSFPMTGPTDVFPIRLSVAVDVSVLVVVALLSYQLVVAAAPARRLSARVVGLACVGLFTAGGSSAGSRSYPRCCAPR